MKFITSIFILFLCLPLNASQRNEPWVVRSNSQHTYAFLLLKLALDSTLNSHGAYQLKTYNTRHSFSRASYMLEQGNVFQVAFFGASQGLGKNLIAIKIPLYQGMLGFRLLASNKKSAAKMAKVKTLAQLRAFEAGFNGQWSDFPIFKTNGLPVETAANFESLYRMLSYRRFDYLPRSIREIDHELVQHQDETNNLVIVDNLAIFYPHPVYFHISPRFKHFANRIEIGLNNILNTGEFKLLFLKHHYQYIKKHKPNELNVIHLKREGEFTMPNTHWWYQPKLSE